MKSTKKVLSLLLVAVMVVGMLAGCSGKEKDPKELFVNALNKYHDAVEDNAVVKLLKDAATGGSVQAIVTEGEGETAQTMDVTAYLNETGDAASMVLNTAMNGKDINVQLLLDKNKVVVGSPIFTKQIGLDFTKAKENFPTSLFGTKGLNLLDLDEESEKELLKYFDELTEMMPQEKKNVDLYQLLLTTLTDNATFTADTKTPVTIDGKEVKNTTVTATITKNNIKSIANKLVTELELQEYVDSTLEQLNELAKYDVEDGEEPVVYKTLNDVINEEFKDKGDEDVVFTIKMVLDTKHDAIMVLELIGEETVKVEFGADPTNITKIVISYPTEELPVDSAEPITKIEKAIINIKKSSTHVEYELLNEEQNGLALVINKAHKEVTFTEIKEGKTQADNAYSFKYDLTADKLSVTFTDEEDGEVMSLTLVVTAKAESPVKFDNYLDLLTMSKDDLQQLLNDFCKFFEIEEEVNIDDLLGLGEPEVEIDGPGTSADDFPENADTSTDTE
jgi:hypothetical protein